MITRYPEETKRAIWRRQANQNSGKPWRNTKGLPVAGPARTTCSAMPLIWKMRNSRGERMPDSAIRLVSERFSHVRAVRAKILYFSAKNFGRKVKSGSQLGRLADGYSPWPMRTCRMSKRANRTDKKRQTARHFSDFSTWRKQVVFGGRVMTFPHACYHYSHQHWPIYL